MEISERKCKNNIEEQKNHPPPLYQFRSISPSPPLYTCRSSSPPPSYICTVYKQGHVRLKKELCVGGFEESNDRSWSKVYFKLKGTLLQIFKNQSSQYPLYHLSMFKANCGIAPDYTKHDNVLRLRLGTTKEQLLIRPFTLPETISWFEHLQSSINISTDIDKRRMPRILTLSRGNYRRGTNQDQEQQQQSRTVTLMVGKTQAIMPVLKCLNDV